MFFKKFIVTVLLLFMNLLPISPVGIHTFKNKKDVIVFNLEKDVIIVGETTYEIIEPPYHWYWDKKHMYKFCRFQCVGNNFSKVFIKFIDKEGYYIIQIYETGKERKDYYCRKVW